MNLGVAKSFLSNAYILKKRMKLRQPKKVNQSRKPFRNISSKLLMKVFYCPRLTAR